MKKLGLIGYPLTHSFSKQYFSEKFKKEKLEDWQYLNFEIKNIENFSEIIKKNPDLVGLNVTIPHKEKILKFTDWQSPEVQKIGAANTLKICQGKIKAYNTDIYGFEQSFKPLLKDYHKQALILGTGGASKAIAYVLEKLNIPYQFVSRNPITQNILSYKQLDKKIITNHQIIINTTPVGSFPNINEKVKIPYDFVTKNHLFYDLIYNPEKTVFLKIAEKKGALIVNGLNMLYLQAEKAWKIWNDKNC